MSKQIDQKVVEMKFDNKNFENNVQTTLSTLDKLKAKLKLDGASKGLEEVNKAGSKVDFSNIERGLDTLTNRFSTMGIIGATAISNITTSVMNLGNRLLHVATDSIIQGGMKRAFNLENARFQLKGLLKDADKVEAVMKNVNDAVDGTAYNLDAAANVASQLAASGIQAGDSMFKSLRGVAGVAAMTNSSYEDIGRIFTQVAGQGRLMGDQLLQLSGRGMNAAATLGQQLGKTEAEIRDMVSKGKIDFETFAMAMDNAFGEHAKEANNTVNGAMANIKAALARVGALFYEPLIKEKGPLVEFLNSIMQKTNEVKKAIEPLATVITGRINEFIPKLTAAVKNMDLTNFTNFIKNLSDFINKLRMSEKTATNLKNTFGGLFALFKIGLNIIKPIISGFFKIIGNFTDLADAVLAATGGLGVWIKQADAYITKNNLFGKAIGFVVDNIDDLIKKTKKFIAQTQILQKVTQVIRDFGKEFLVFDKIKTGLSGIYKFVSGIVTAIAKGFAALVHSGDLKAGLDAINTGIFGGLLVNLTNFVKNLAIATKTTGSMFSKIKGTLEEVKNILKSWQQEIKSKILLNIAKAVSLLAASLFVLSLIDGDKLVNSLVGLGGVLFEFTIALKAISKMSNDFKKVGRTSILMISLSSSLLIMATALKKLGSLNIDQTMTALVSIAVSIKLLTAALQAIPNRKHLSSMSLGIISLSLSLIVFAKAVEKMGSLSVYTLAKGITAVSISLLAMSKAINSIPKNSIAGGGAFLLMATSMIMIGNTLRKLGAMTWDEIGRGLAAMGGALAILTIAMRSLPKEEKGFFSESKSQSMINSTLALIILSYSLKKLSDLSWDDIGRSLTAMGGALAILVTTMAIINAGGLSSKGLISATSSVILLGLGLSVLSKISWEGIAKGLVSLAGAFTLIIIATTLLSGSVGVLLALGGSMALFGVGVAAFGAGLILIANGIGALALALAGGATAIVAGIAAIIEGLLGMIPDIIKICGAMITGLCTVIIEASPLLAKAVMVLLYETLKAIADYTPMIVTVLLDLFINVIRSLTDRMPELVVSIAELLNAFFKGFIEALQILDVSQLKEGLMAVGIVTTILLLLAALAHVVPQAAIGVLAFGALVAELAIVIAALGKLSLIPGIDQLIGNGGNILMLVGNAIGKFVGGIIGGFSEGFTNSLPKVGDNLSKFAKNITPFIKSMSTVKMDLVARVGSLGAAIYALSAANFVSGLSKLLSFGQSFPELGTQLSKFAKNLQPFLDKTSYLDPTMLDGVKMLVKTILLITAANFINSLASFGTILTGKNSLSNFGKEIANLGSSISKFVSNLGTFKEEQISSVKFACEALKTLAKAAKEIPNEGGLWASLVGDNSIGQFSDQLPKLGSKMKEFVTNLGNFDKNKADVVTLLCQSLKTLAKAAKEIPNEGGLWASLVGDNSLAKFSDQLPKVGEAITSFANSLSAEGGLTKEKAELCVLAAKSIKNLAIAAQEIPKQDGLWQKIAGQGSLKDFSLDFGLVAQALSNFGNTLANGNFDQTKADLCVLATNSIKNLASAAKEIPKDNFWKKLTGDGMSDFAKFALDFNLVGEALSNFGNTLTKGGFDQTKADICVLATNAIKNLANAAKDIPSDDGVWKGLVGDGRSAFSKFALDFGVVGESLVGFAFTLEKGGFTQEKGELCVTAVKTIRELALASKTLSDIQEPWAWLDGKQDLSQFAGKMPGIAEAIRDFANNLGDFKEDKLATTKVAVSVIKALAELGDVDLSKLSKGISSVGDKLTSFAENIASFSNSMSTVNPDALSAAVDNLNKVIKLCKSIDGLSKDGLSNFVKGLSSLGKQGLDEFINAFSTVDAETRVKNTAVDLLNKFISALENKRGDIKDKFESLASSGISKLTSSGMIEKMNNAGKAFAQGFANGITWNVKLASSAGRALGDKAYEAAKKAIDSRSPSKKARKLGNWFGQGFIIGLNQYQDAVYNESSTIGNNAKNGLEDSLYNINRIIEGAIDDSLTITPILDLTNIRSGAKTVNGLFSNLTLDGNLNAIASNMTYRGRNNSNSDVVNAINNLGDRVEKHGDVYNINGITYGDDSAVAEAVELLVRAANIERRT